MQKPFILENLLKHLDLLSIVNIFVNIIKIIKFNYNNLNQIYNKYIDVDLS